METERWGRSDDGSMQWMAKRNLSAVRCNRPGKLSDPWTHRRLLFQVSATERLISIFPEPCARFEIAATLNLAEHTHRRLLSTLEENGQDDSFGRERWASRKLIQCPDSEKLTGNRANHRSHTFASDLPSLVSMCSLRTTRAAT